MIELFGCYWSWVERSYLSDALTQCEDRPIARGSYNCGYNCQVIVVKNCLLWPDDMDCWDP